MSTGGLLAVHAHPDDETLSNGALLATFAAAGRPVTLVTCTRGERGEVIPPGLAHLEGDGPALAQHREDELAAAAAALGVGDRVFLDQVPVPGARGEPVRYEDSGMAWHAPGRAGAAGAVPEHAFVAADLDLVAARLAALITDRRPDVVVGYEPGGGYGHPDHVRAHEVMTRAVDLLAGPAPVVLWTVLDADALRAAYAALPPAPAGMTNPSAAGPLPSAAGSRVDLRVDVPPVAEAVRAALEAYRTQVTLVPEEWGTGAVLGTYALSNGVVQPVLREECYRYAPGSAARAGLLDWPTGIGR